MIFVNFKTYQSGTGENALRMARIIERVVRETGVEMAAVVQGVDVFRVSQEVLVPVWCQHADGIEYGANTGWMLPEAVKEAGAVGVVLNHSEHKFVNIKHQILKIKKKEEIIGLERTVERCKEVGLKTVVCGASLEEIESILKLNSDFVAYEPPEFIGNREKSVASEKPEVIIDVMEIANQERVLIGAGIHSAEDIRIGLRLGAFGFLVASDIMKAENPGIELLDLVKGYKSNSVIDVL